METLKDPGIAIEHVLLLKSHVEMANFDGERKFNLRLIGLRPSVSEDGKTFDLYAAFDVMHGIEKPLFKLTCEFFARYTRRDNANMEWKDFTSPMALAHIIPYLREYVTNITNRLPVPVLMLNPVNTHAMIADYEDRKRRTEEAKAAQPQQKPA